MSVFRGSVKAGGYLFCGIERRLLATVRWTVVTAVGRLRVPPVAE